MKEWKVYIKGVQNRGNEVIKALEERGGVDCKLDGEDSKYLYYINHNGSISLALIDSELGKIIIDNYNEIKLLDKWKKGDILVNDNNANEFYVFNTFVKNSKIFVYFRVTKSLITYKVSGISISDICTFIPSNTTCHKANYKELKTFYDILAARNLTWDAYNKELQCGNYTYFYPKNGHYYFRRDTLRCKDRTTGEWYNAVLYSDVDGQYVREVNDFNTKFKKVEI